MRKFSLFLLITLLLLACSTVNLIPSLAPTGTPTASPTASDTPTITPVPTRTSTPTLQNTATLIISEFNTPVVLVTDEGGPPLGSASLTPFAPLSPGGAFESVELSETKIFYGVCRPNVTQMTVKVENAEEVNRVYIFFRLESTEEPGDTSRWIGSSTFDDGGGIFLYRLRANNITERRNYLKSWVHYQFVAEDADGEIIGRTPVYTRTLTLEPCR